jgi:hypothetical protein
MQSITQHRAALSLSATSSYVAGSADCVLPGVVDPVLSAVGRLGMLRGVKLRLLA